MTEQEWTTVCRGFTSLFDIVKELAPEKMDKDNVYQAGLILQDEIKRIRALQSLKFNFLSVPALPYSSTGIRSTGMRSGFDWQKRNSELEKKKEHERQNAEADSILETRPQDLESLLKQSIEKAKKDRQGE